MLKASKFSESFHITNDPSADAHHDPLEGTLTLLGSEALAVDVLGPGFLKRLRRGDAVLARVLFPPVLDELVEGPTTDAVFHMAKVASTVPVKTRVLTFLREAGGAAFASKMIADRVGAKWSEVDEVLPGLRDENLVRSSQRKWYAVMGRPVFGKPGVFEPIPGREKR